MQSVLKTGPLMASTGTQNSFRIWTRASSLPPVNQLGSKNQAVIARFASTAGINSIGESLNPVLEGATNFAPGSWREGTAPMVPLAEKIGANPVQLLGP